MDIVPLVAMPVGGPTNAVSFSRGPKWLFTGGDDGYIRKYNLVASLNGEAPLTVAQRHQIVENITLGGLLEGYWENEVPQRELDTPNGVYQPKLSPVYSLCNDANGFWVLSGLDNGGINMTSSRMNEGATQWYFRDASTCSTYQGAAHSDTVSCLTTGRDGTSFLSGSWDKTVIEWDLDVGKSRNVYSTSGQLSTVEWRPEGVADVEVTVGGGVEEGDNESLFGSEDEEGGDENGDGTNAAAGTTRPIDSTHTFLTSTINGEINVWDVRAPQEVMRIAPGSEIQRPWSMSVTWASDGGSFFVGGKKGTVSQWDIRAGGASRGNSSPLREIKLPAMSGQISSVARVDSRYLVLGGEDNVRVYDLEHGGAGGAGGAAGGSGGSGGVDGTPYVTVPSHSRGLVAAIRVQDGLMAVARGARGWGSSSADHTFLYKIHFAQ